MTSIPLAIVPWPASLHLLPSAAKEGRGLIVIGVSTPDSTIRHAAREKVRLTLRQVLGALLSRPAETIQLVSHPGQPLRLAPPDQYIGLSVAHEPGLSLAAIYQHGAVGIDLMRINQQPDWLADWEGVADTYLGQRARERIAKNSPAQRANAFAQEWTRLEACLKCHGLPLTESTPALERRLESCDLIELRLPPGLVGTVATLPRDKKALQ